MFEKPTINDFLSQLRMHHDEAVDGMGRAKSKIQAHASAKGALQSGRTIILILEAMDATVERTVSKMLGELRRAADKTDLDNHELRTLTVSRIDEMTSAVISAAQWGTGGRWIRSGSVEKTVEEREQSLRQNVLFWIRQFDVGFDSAAEPEPVGHVTNVVNARDITGAIQQGQTGLTQKAHVQINVAAAVEAVRQLENELASLEIPHAARIDIDSDLATIKAQLRKPTPGIGILQEAVRSVRNVTEGVLGGLLTPHAVTALAILSQALGLH